ncbi:hypothetical protein LC605_20745 [Nostoc sp. CHAB 5836]|uniref:hypothetical protein n=1 Tax=Nostoc sp. CHAB 5836 TaxID=2780404 RepID=UPI001E5D5416|nr:hypothetical protein [Nostoc sp. CHAB 5836]MCC5617470.1 hypothetical protein [Nostoc sp. CHAB 5836]
MRRHEEIAALERAISSAGSTNQVVGRKKRKKNKTFGIAAFTPNVEFLENPIILKDDDLVWTERFRSGVFCFHENQLGISFKNAHAGLQWEVERKYCEGRLDVHSDVRGITCRIPILPGTFQPISAPLEQQELMRRLLAGAFIVEELLEAEAKHQGDEECDRIRLKLNQFYDSFVLEFGLLVNCNSYYDSLWPDVRLEIYLSQLTDSAGNKSDIFRERINHPPQELKGQQFFEADLDTRLTNAFSWCMGWYGEVRLDEIAEKSGMDKQRALEILQKLELVYRHWVGLDCQKLKTMQLFNVVNSHRFLSGDILSKLENAEQAIEFDPSFKEEAIALKKILPLTIAIADIDIAIGVTWIPTRYYNQFCKQVFDVDATFFFSLVSGTWDLALSNGNSEANQITYGYSYVKKDKVEIIPAVGDKIESGLFTMAMHFKAPYIPNPGFRREALLKQEELRKLWGEWCKEGDRGLELERIYNHKFNRLVLPNWDNTAPLGFKDILRATGMSEAWIERLRPYQMDSIWRMWRHPHFRTVCRICQRTRAVTDVLECLPHQAV